MGSRDVAGWVVRRAGLARFTTFACALGLALAAVTGARPAVALAGLTTAQAGALVGVGLNRARSRCPGRPGCAVGAWLLIGSVLLVGLFGGYLVGNVRVAALVGGVLQ
ncbi:MAG: hypothetical protein GX630_08650, partial [Actinobacteria bacterium]|nr:hypothetical protein [Actinomycetota bacterium]